MYRGTSWIWKVVILVVFIWIIFSLGGKIENFLISSINRLENRPIQLHGIILLLFITGAHTIVAISAPLAAKTSINIWALYFMYLIVPTISDYIWYRFAYGNKEQIKQGLPRFVKKKIGSSKSAKKEHIWIRKPFLTTFLSKGIPYVTVPTVIIGGISGISYRKLFPGLVLGEFIWGSSLVWGFYFLGSYVQSTINYIALALLMLFLTREFRKTAWAKRITNKFFETKETV